MVELGIVQSFFPCKPMQDASQFQQSSQKRRRKGGLKFSSRKDLQRSKMRSFRKLDDIAEVTRVLEFGTEEEFIELSQIENSRPRQQKGGRGRGRRKRAQSTTSFEAEDEVGVGDGGDSRAQIQVRHECKCIFFI